jgi:Trk-type K+ transport system membrane component
LQGLSLLNNSLIELRTHTFLLLVVCAPMLLGNTAFPLALRGVVRLMNRFFATSRRDERAYA